MLTVYRITLAGRFRYLLWGALGVAFVAVSCSAIATRHTASRPMLLPEWLFAGAVISIWGGLAAYCVVRAFAQTPRLVVTKEALTYQGLFTTIAIPCASVVAATAMLDKAAGFQWVRLAVASPQGTSQRHIKLDLTGLSPSRFDFLRQLSVVAPNAHVQLTAGI